MAEKRRRKNKRRRNRNQKIRQIKRNIRLLLIVVVLSVIVIGTIQLMLGRYIKNHDDGKILDGVRIGGTDVSGMTEEEALRSVKAALESYAPVTVKFDVGESREFEASLEELGLKTDDLKKTVQKAARYGKEGNRVTAYKIMRSAQKGKLDYQFPLNYKVSEKACAEALKLRAADLLTLPVNAAVTQQNGAVTVIPGQDGEVLDTKATVKSVNKYLNDNWDFKTVKVKAVIKNTKPEITEKKLKEVTDLLGTYTTVYGSDGSGRSQNVETGARHIGGHLLQPGEEMSADEAMRPYTFENGYAEAASYESNKVVTSMGGGICQVSTTLYNALLYAELEIVERYPHSMLVSYVEPSKDAAIADDLLDLVFRNNQKSPVYIEAVLEGGSLTFNIYGKETRDPGRTLEFISEITETTEPEGKRFVATEDYIGYIGLQSYAQSEISARLWKVIYQDGAELSRDIINYSQYVAAPETYGVGTASDDPEAVQKINNALQSQDEAVIQAAINEILYGQPEEEGAE